MLQGKDPISLFIKGKFSAAILLSCNMAAATPSSSSSPPPPSSSLSSSSSLDLPECFVWPSSDCPIPEHGAFASEEDVPTIDISGKQSGSEEALKQVSDEIRRACNDSGFFQIVNHGIDLELVKQVHDNARDFFELPLDTKMQASRRAGNSFGYAGMFAGRFNSKCPWKETLSLQHTPESNVQDYLHKVYQDEEDDYNRRCGVYIKYCKAMEELGNELMELIALSLGLPRRIFRKYFNRSFSIFRMNLYPSCPQHASRVLGTGPHTDPCALTILHQDDVGGLQVFTGDTWVTVKPRFDAFVISIGDTFQALCNHRYKSAKHRAVIDTIRHRHSLVFFINPALDTIIKPMAELVDEEHPQKHRDFIWGQLLDFTQNHYRTDVHTLDALETYLQQQQQHQQHQNQHQQQLQLQQERQ